MVTAGNDCMIKRWAINERIDLQLDAQAAILKRLISSEFVPEMYKGAYFEIPIHPNHFLYKFTGKQPIENF